jgi:hypothetical protein
MLHDYKRIFQMYVPDVSYVSYVCCKYFHLDVTKVDLDIAYTCMLQAYFSNGFRCFASVLSGCSIYLQWFQVFFRCFCKCFKRMFQVFYLSSLYVITVAYGCFKSIRGCTWDAHGKWLEVRATFGAARALARKPNALGCSLAR